MARAEREFDVVVVGGGPGGEVLAGRCGDGGLTVALVESERVGGECSYWACIPSKALLRPGEALASARRVPGAREALRAQPDAAAALRRRDALVHNLDDSEQVPWLKEHHVMLFRGRGRLDGPRKVKVRGPLGEETLAARRAVVLATGSVPWAPPIPGLAEARPWSSRDATSAHAVPPRLLVLGGGAVGVELAQAFKRLGADEVTVVEATDRLLAREEPFAGEVLAEVFERECIDVRTGRKVVEVRRVEGTVHAKLDDGGALAADEVLVAVGRRPATGDLGLESVGIDAGGAIAVDEQLRAKGAEGGWLFAIGDVNGRALFTHMAKYQARIAADTILGREGAKPPTFAAGEAAVLPRVVFTDPQVAAVGLTADEARRKGIEVVTACVPLDEVAGAAVRGLDVVGAAQWVVDRRRGCLVGATLVGAEVGELLHAATVAIVGEIPLERLAHAVPSFPSVSEIWLKLHEATRT